MQLGIIKEKIVGILNKIHLLIFKSAMGPGTTNFAKNVGYMGFGTVGYTLILFIVNFSVVRFFGPVEYGKYVLLFSAATIMTTPMFLGVHTALTKYLPEYESDENAQKKLLGSGLLIVTLLSLLSVLVLIVCREFFSGYLKLVPALFIFSVVYAVFAVYKGLADALLKGLKQFRRQAMYALVYAAIIVFSFFLLWFITGLRSYAVYAWAIICGIVIYTVVIAVNKRSLLWPIIFEKRSASILFRYGWYSTIGSLAWLTIVNSDRLFLNSYTDAKTVGIYAAYCGASLIITSRALGIFSGVFFPTASGVKDKRLLSKKINRMMILGIAPLFILNCLTILFALFIYGSQYPIKVSWVLAFALSSLLYTYANIRWNLVASEGLASIKYCASHSIIGVLLNLFLNWLFISSFGISGAVWSFAICSAYLFIVTLLYFKNEKGRT